MRKKNVSMIGNLTRDMMNDVKESCRTGMEMPCRLSL